MNSPAKAQEPTMEEILASIRRIISDDTGTDAPEAPVETAKPAAASAKPKPAPVPESEPAAELDQNDIDAVFAAMDADEAEEPAPAPKARKPAPEPEPDNEQDDVLELTDDMSDWDVTEESEPEPEVAEAKAEAPKTRPSLVQVPADSPDDEEDAAAQDDMAAAMTRPEPRVSSRAMSAPVSELLSAHASAAVSSAFGTLAHTILNQNPRTLEDLVGDMLRPMLKSWLDENLPSLVERMVRAEIERVSRGK